MKELTPIVVFLVAVLFSVAEAEQFSAKVIGVIGGDSIKVLYKGKEWKIRLAGIEAPQEGQPYGSEARKFILSYAMGQTVAIRTTVMDRAGSAIGEVTLPDERNLGEELAKRGFAWKLKLK